MIFCSQVLQCGISPSLYRYFGEENYANYSNEETNNVLNEIYNISDNKILLEKYRTLQNIYQEDVPYIGLYFNKQSLIYGKNLAGTITPTWYNALYNIETWYRKK